MSKTPTYFAFLLRFWQIGDDAEECDIQEIGSQANWRASLEDPRTREIRGFASLDTLFDFLLALCQKPRSHPLDSSSEEEPWHPKISA